MTMGPSRARRLPGLDDVVAGGQIIGARARQEDDFRIVGFPAGRPDGCDLLMVVADGLGGHLGGAEASDAAVSAFVDEFERAKSGGGVAAHLRAALDEANAAVGRRADETRQYGMGCTLVACAVTEDGAVHWISVGDSPLWRLRAASDGGDRNRHRLVRLNQDHSMRPVIEEMVRLGRLTAEEARRAPVHELHSAVMGGRIEMVDEGAAPVRLADGDRIVVASDGIETLTDDEIGQVCGARRTAPEIVADLLADVEARAVPTQDNATVVVYRHPGPPRVGRLRSGA